jgi:ubiquinone/menaquinone biosynthesis C-methylase UbiE
MDESRFSDELGEEYDLFSVVLPHQDLIQKESVLSLKKGLVGKNNPSVLEIGFGTGITTKEILSCIKGINLISIDNEPKMYERAKNNLEKTVSDFSFLKMQDALSFLKSQPSENLDGIISVWVIHNLLKEEQSDVLKEIFRVLKSGGFFVNGDKIVVSNKHEYQKDFSWQIDLFNKFSEMKRDDLRILWTEHYKEDADKSRLIKQDEYKKHLLSIGFRKVSFSNRNHLDVIAVAVK